MCILTYGDPGCLGKCSTAELYTPAQSQKPLPPEDCGYVTFYFLRKYYSMQGKGAHVLPLVITQLRGVWGRERDRDRYEATIVKCTHPLQGIWVNDTWEFLLLFLQLFFEYENVKMNPNKKQSSRAQDQEILKKANKLTLPVQLYSQPPQNIRNLYFVIIPL